MKKGDSVIIILLGIFGLILLFELLITFKVISPPSLSKLFGFLPHKTQPIKSPNQKPYICPAPIYPCVGKKVYNSGQFLGTAFKLDPGRPVFAAISGEINYKKEDNEGISLVDATITGEGKDKGYTATYRFIGEKGKDGLVGLAVAGSFFKGKENRGLNLIFRLFDPKGNEVEVTPAEFK